jgi:guanylate kinase
MSEPQLKYYDEFKTILSDYQISDDGKAALANLRLVLLMAATSTGRSRISRSLVESGRYYYIISDTTRPPQLRDGQLEQDGVQYFFREEKDLLDDLKHGKFLEAELVHDQQISGISIRELEKAKVSGKVAFTEVDIAGVRNIKRVKPDSFAIFLLPPSFEEWQKRMASRGGLAPGETRRRLATAARFFEEAPKTGYFQYVITEEVEQTATIIDKIAAGEPNPHQERGKELLISLQEQLNQKLKTL